MSPNPIIDFRARPPYKGFLALSIYGHGKPDPKRPTLEGFIREMDEAGVKIAVVHGRQTPNSMRYRGSWQVPYGSVANDDISELLQKYPDRFVGLAGIDGSTGPSALKEIDRCKKAGFRGVALDNGWCDPPLFDDDVKLMQIYEKCEGEQLLVAITSSIAVGPDAEYCNPTHVQRVGVRFPKLKIVLSHGAWPWTTLACAVVFRNPNMYMNPDIYLDKVGSERYIEGANTVLSKQLLFASSYPDKRLQPAIDQFKALPFKNDEIRRAGLGENAAQLLGLKG